MTPGQPYQITLDLEMPESPTNMELGMFLVKMSCYSNDGLILDVSMQTVCSRAYTNMLHRNVSPCHYSITNLAQEHLSSSETFFCVLNLDNASLSLLPAADYGDSDVAAFDADGSN